MTSTTERLSRFVPRAGTRKPVLIVNPHAGQKLGVSVNWGSAEAVTAALEAAGVRCDLWPTRYAGHATELARQAVQEGAPLVVAAGGDGTLVEVAVALAGTETVLGIMPLGSVMNTARSLCVPRDLGAAARTLVDGRVLAMDLGRVHGRLYLEAGGVGLVAGLFGYFDRLDSGAPRVGTLRAVLRFVRGLGSPRLIVEVDGQRRLVRSPMVTVSNGPFVGAAYAIAPEARIDDGLLDVVIFRRAGPLHVLAHLALMAGGRRIGPPPDADTLRARRVSITQVRRRPLPVHADGRAVGATPATFELVPAALRVIVGTAGPGAGCAFGDY
ncbi:MAG: YegS/Rv2252/BmrU family lipid kinase [Chloroflexi bacterium]|nr:YegS/Rv2252/BmrU family lipid kinase [Chloroflexota bacterium]